MQVSELLVCISKARRQRKQNERQEKLAKEEAARAEVRRARDSSHTTLCCNVHPLK